MRRDDGVWTEEAILREVERWIWSPEGAVRIEEGRRLLVHMPRHWGRSNVWRFAVADEVRTRDLIEETIAEVRAAGSAKLVWHTSGATEPGNIGELLAEQGFKVTEELEVLAFELGDGAEPRLPRLGTPGDVTAELVRDVEGIEEASYIKARVFSSEAYEEEIDEFARGLKRLRRRGWSRRSRAAREEFALSFLAFVELNGGGKRRAVASAGLGMAGEVGRMFGAGTLVEFRGRGAYRALVLERCRVAHALGATLVLAKARVGTSGPLLRRAGFRLAGTGRQHELQLR